MSKILFVFRQSIIDKKNPNGIICFYESFAKELNSCGNEVLCINLEPFKEYFDTTLTNLNSFQKSELISKIKIFNPDVILAFNNQISEEIIENTTCPICLTDADGINLFANKQLIKQYKERYYLCSFYKGWENNQYNSLGFDNNRIIFLNMATSIKNEKVEKTSNISFIGTKFGNLSAVMNDKISENKEMYEDLNKYYQNQYDTYDNFIKKWTKKLNCNVIDLYPLLDTRIYVLQSIFDLGLKIYGVNWNFLPKELISLKLAWENNPKYTLSDNQDIYNSSKINISISHPQCKGYAFPWRIYDIMASNGLLISSYSKLLETQTKDIVNIPMFKSPYEARDLCKYALKNPSYREDIIIASNEFIEKYGRWKYNFEILSEKLNINLLNNTNEIKEFEVYSDIVVKQKEKTLTLNNRIKLFWYSIRFAFAQIPFLNIFQNADKLYEKIAKYWN